MNSFYSIIPFAVKKRGLALNSELNLRNHAPIQNSIQPLNYPVPFDGFNKNRCVSLQCIHLYAKILLVLWSSGHPSGIFRRTASQFTSNTTLFCDVVRTALLAPLFSLSSSHPSYLRPISV